MDLDILLVSSGQLSANPRLVKEALTLQKAGYKIGVLYCLLSPWADDYDKIIISSCPNIKWWSTGWHSLESKWLYRYALLRLKLYKLFWYLLGNNQDIAIRSITLYSQNLEKIALGIKAKIYIGHNLGALPAIVKAAKKFDSKSIFDFEDFHRGEFPKGHSNIKKIQLIEEKYISNIDFSTAASSGIKREYENIFRSLSIQVINNVFSVNYACKEVMDLPRKPLKLFWFSQYIGKQRGLETVLLAMSKLPRPSVTLTLMGTITDELKFYFIQLASFLKLEKDQFFLLDPVEEKKISSIASHYHIGLCSEYSFIPNRDICLTNKLFMYLLAGNALLLTNTKSQYEFWNENPDIGLVYEQENAESLVKVMQYYLEYPSTLYIHRQNALTIAKSKYNWEIEEPLFLKAINKIVHS